MQCDCRAGQPVLFSSRADVGCVLVAGVGRRWSQWNHLGIHDELEVAPVYKPIVNLGQSSAASVNDKMAFTFLEKRVGDDQIVGL